MNLLLPMFIGFILFCIVMAFRSLYKFSEKVTRINNELSQIEFTAAFAKSKDELNSIIDTLFDYYNNKCVTREQKWRAMQIYSYIKGRKDGSPNERQG